MLQIDAKIANFHTPHLEISTKVTSALLAADDIKRSQYFLQVCVSLFLRYVNAKGSSYFPLLSWYS